MTLPNGDILTRDEFTGESVVSHYGVWSNVRHCWYCRNCGDILR